MAIDAVEAGRSETTLTPFQIKSIELFVRVSAALSLPRSFGEIYGLLVATEPPLSLDDVSELAGISRGSSHQGLRWLKDAGAIRGVYVAGVRKEHFTAETELRNLVTSFLRERVEPHLESGHDWLAELREAAGPGKNSFEAARVDKLRRWHSTVEKSLPLLKALFATI